jgi:DNA-binding transcriptional LysR family regulator
MNLRSIDLNLLVVLEALVDARSVSRAAEKIGLTQSAVSHALRRLRLTCKDEILVRTAAAMEPTPYALELAQAVAASLRQIEAAIDRGHTFDAASSEQAFSLRVSDYVAVYLLPRLIQRMRREAPLARLHVKQFDPRQAGEPAERGEVQVGLATDPLHQVGASSVRVLEDRFVVLMNQAHPRAREPLALEDYLELRHLKVSWAGVGSNAIDDALARIGRRRNIAVVVPSWLEMREVILSTDLVAAAPSRWLSLDAFRGFAAFPLPIDGISVQVDVAWDPRDTMDPAQAWFRSLVQDIFRQL